MNYQVIPFWGRAFVLVTIMAIIMSSFQAAINILTGSTKYQGIDGRFCDNVMYHNISQSPTNYQVIPAEGGHFSSVCN